MTIERRVTPVRNSGNIVDVFEGSRRPHSLVFTTLRCFSGCEEEDKKNEITLAVSRALCLKQIQQY